MVLCALLTVAAVALPALADWPQFHDTESRTGVDWSETTLTPANVSRMKMLWSKSAGASKQGVNSSPVVVAGVVYIGSDDGHVWAYSAATGALRWSKWAGGPVRSTPAVYNGGVFVGSNDNNLYKFKATDGTKLWTKNLGGDITGSPLVVNGVVYIGSRGGWFYAISASTGATLWKYNTWSVWDSAAYANGTVYVGSDKSVLFAFNATNGSLKWSFTAPDGRLRGTPAVSGGRVFFGTDGGRVYALNAASGSKLWWGTAVPPGDGYVRSAPAVADGRVYITTGETTVPMDGHAVAFKLDAASDGSWVNYLWKHKLADYSTSSPAYANGVLYLGSFDHRLYALAPATGAELWTSGWCSSRCLPRGISGSPAVNNGKVYIGVRDGRVYAFGLP